MNRREFHGTVAGALMAAAGVRRPAVRQEPRVDGARVLRNLEALSRFGRTPEGGVSRVAYSQADLDAREFAMRLMRAAGLDPSIDAAGNVIGRRAGTAPGLPPLMLGSHIDSVPGGGNYDGMVGSMGALEAAHALADHGYALRHPLEVVLFQNEEGGKTGSRAMSGEVMAKELELVTASGLTIRDGIRRLGGDPDRLDAVRRGPDSTAAFLELHIEQGAVLERAGIDIGVVEGIVGIKRWNVTVQGFTNHAGTTPMDQRQDALLAAARLADAVNRVVTAEPGRQVGTVGRIQAVPGAANVIAGTAHLSIELRDLVESTIDALFARIEEEATAIGRATGTTFEFDHIYTSRPAPTDPRLRSMISDTADRLGLRTLAMPSGAGHDAQSIAQFAPVGMIFVPSVDGISHSPHEHSRPEAIVAGVQVLLSALIEADRRDWSR